MQNAKYKRKINPALNAWFDAKLKNNGLFQHAMKERDSRMIFILAVESCVGVMESGGDNQGPMVELFQSVVGKAEKESWCFPGDTEILTEKGWQKFKELERGIKVAQVDEHGILTYDFPYKYIEKEYNGEGFHVKTRGIDLKCDKGHRFYGHFNNKLATEFASLEKVTTCLSIPAFRIEKPSNSISDEQLLFLAAFISDGFIHGKKSNRIRIQVSKERKIKVLDAFQFISKYTQKKVYGPTTKNPLTTYTFKIPDFFKGIFKDYKILSWEFINSLGKEQCKRFIEYYLFFDGNIKTGGNARSLFSSRKELADQLLTICLHAGFNCSMRVGYSKISKKPCYGIAFNDHKTRHFHKKNINKITLNEKLYCVSVPEERIIVRGSATSTPIMTGNCVSMLQAALCYAEIRSGLMSPLPATESTLELWLTSPQTQRVKLRPARGAIAVWNFTGTKLGHCGMFLEFFGRHMIDFKTIEGNTHDGLGFVREGNGVFLRERSLKSPEGFELLGFLKPF